VRRKKISNKHEQKIMLKIRV